MSLQRSDFVEDDPAGGETQANLSGELNRGKLRLSVAVESDELLMQNKLLDNEISIVELVWSI